MAEEAQKVVEAAGYNFELILSGDELAVAKQVENIENAINKNVDGLIVAPMDGSAVIPALEKAKLREFLLLSQMRRSMRT